MMTYPEAVSRLSAALGDGPAAELAASALVEADALGQPRFGIAILDEWTGTETTVPISAPPQPLLSIDCSASFAPVAVAAAAIDLAVAASQFGIAAVFLRGVRGFGRLAPFVRHLADDGLLGMAGAEGPPFVAPHDGNRAVIGTNPIALAIGRGADRVVIDVASSMATMADIRGAQTSGAPLRDGIAIDHAGQPTNIAGEVAALLPRGGQVGSLLGLIVELMAGIAGGGRGDQNGRGVFLLALDPTKAAEGIDWKAKLAGLKGDWTSGGGHWPRGGGIGPNAVLDADFVRRLDAQLARMTAQQTPAR